jgi:hypothetical protein
MSLAVVAPPAGAASGDEIPPIDCGVVYREAGPISQSIHAIEKSLMPLNLAYLVHDLNCSTVIRLEIQLGLQPKPGCPGGPLG